MVTKAMLSLLTKKGKKERIGKFYQKETPKSLQKYYANAILEVFLAGKGGWLYAFLQGSCIFATVLSFFTDLAYKLKI